MSDERIPTTRYQPYRVVVAEGARIALMTCRDCYATVVLDPDDAVDVHSLNIQAAND